MIVSRMAAAKKLCPPLWLFAATITVGIVVLYSFRRQKQGFINMDTLTPELLLQPMITGNEANESLRKVLIYAENNPLDLTNFLNFMRENFFVPTAEFADPPNTSGIVKRYKSVFKENVVKISDIPKMPTIS